MNDVERLLRIDPRFEDPRKLQQLADLGEVEWPGTRELARKQAEFFDVPFHVVERTQDTLLEYVYKRRMWPDSVTRYCTSEFKRAPCSRVMTSLVQGWRRKQGWSPQKSLVQHAEGPGHIRASPS